MIYENYIYILYIKIIFYLINTMFFGNKALEKNQFWGFFVRIR